MFWLMSLSNFVVREVHFLDATEYVLIVVNLVVGFGCSLPMARLLCSVTGLPNKLLRYTATCIGIYFVECVAIVMGMGIPVFSISLAFLWGVVFGMWLRYKAPARDILKASLFLSLYTSLPAVSFITVPLVGWIGGWDVLSTESGSIFGIPDFLFLPWPFNTILGFFAALVVAAVVFKTVITVGEISILTHISKDCLRG